jgi:transposase
MTAIATEMFSHTDDLNRLNAEARAVEVVMKEVQGFGDALQTTPDEATTVSPSLLLATLTYCYAVGIYCSEDVESACRSNPRVKLLAHDMDLDSQTIRRFRRRHRDWIETCLTRVLTGVSAGGNLLASSAREKLDLAIMMDMAMAE